MTPEQVNDHVYNHFDAEGEMSPDNPDYIRNKLLKLIQIIEIWFDEIVVRNDVDRNAIDAALSISKEIRSALKLIGELDGKLNQGQADFQLIELKRQYKMLTDTVMMELCPECQDKILHAVEQKALTT
ncbi:hypothetical protein D4R86_03785 [bacterium]|nr:MAG: hypothetical protein D4R86_03785 [bacterium]